MGRIVVTEYISLDGVIEAPGGGEDYKHQGWTFEIERGQEGDRFKLNETLEAVFPIALGSGKRLFAEHPDKTPPRLVDSRTVGAGIALLTYEPA